MGDAADGTYNSMLNLAKSSQLFDASKMIEAERKLQSTGGLTTNQIKEMLPLIEEFAVKWNKDIVETASGFGRAIMTGTTRPIREMTGDMLKLGEVLEKGGMKGDKNAITNNINTLISQCKSFFSLNY